LRIFWSAIRIETLQKPSDMSQIAQKKKAGYLRLDRSNIRHPA
jgi:hypothetical protein